MVLTFTVPESKIKDPETTSAFFESIGEPEFAQPHEVFPSPEEEYLADPDEDDWEEDDPVEVPPPVTERDWEGLASLLETLKSRGNIATIQAFLDEEALPLKASDVMSADSVPNLLEEFRNPARAEFRNLLAMLENQDGFSSIAPLLVKNREAIESILFPAPVPPPKKPSPVPKEIKRDKVSDLNKSTAYLYARDWIQSRRGEFKSSTEWAKELEKAGYLSRTGNRMSWKTFTVPIPELARNGEIVKRADGLYGCP